MVTALETAFRSWVKANPKPSDADNWDQQCAKGQFRFNKWLLWLVAPKVTGPGAVDVARASGTLNKDWTKAPIGAWHYWSVGTHGHVGQDLAGGGTRIAMFGSAKLNITLAPFVGISSIAKYGSSTYMGWATNYGGGRSKLPVEPTLSPFQRIVGGEGANLRTEPKRTATNVVDLIAPGEVLTLKGYAIGESVEGINRWGVTAKGRYVWLGGLENPRVGVLPNLTPIPPVVTPPVEPTPPPVVVTPTPSDPVATPPVLTSTQSAAAVTIIVDAVIALGKTLSAFLKR